MNPAPASYLSGMTLAELCAQYWSTYAAPPAAAPRGRSLAKSLREEARAELTARLGEQRALETLDDYQNGWLPETPAVQAVSAPPRPDRIRNPRRMYIEQKTDGNRILEHKGPAVLADVSTSKTGQTLYALGKTFERLKRGGVYGNYRCLEDGNEYWISGIKKRGSNRHRFGKGPITNT
jgi:hypothetical protein